jgi:endonuclease YncB( thermonuclease family)
MRRKFSTTEFVTAGMVRSRCAVALVVLVLWIAAVDLCARDGSKDWIVLENCRLIPNPANDGDSFHVSAGANEYVFRLYLVDAPETDEMKPVRLPEQAKYFGISVPQAIEVGQAAKEFTRQKLSEPFTVFTHMSDAMGHSRIERFYAYVQTKDGDLGEQLICNGLARIYGFKAAPPGLKSSGVELEKLQQFENQARQEKIGAWGINVGRLNVRAANPAGFSVFAPAAKNRSRVMPAGSPAIISSSPKPAVPQLPAIGGEMRNSHAKERRRSAGSISTQRQKKS